MKLTRFFVHQNLLLRDLDLRFDRPNRLDETSNYALDFLVGVNGSGKSTLLRSLVQVFTNLRTNNYTRYDFVVEYKLGRGEKQSNVVIAKNGQVPLHMTIQDWQGVEIYNAESIDTKYLPARVVVYSTGSESEWQRIYDGATNEPGDINASAGLLDDPVQRNIMELPGFMAESPEQAIDQGEPPFWLIRSNRLSTFALCGLLSNLASERQPLTEVLSSIGISKVSGFSLRFQLHERLSPFEEYNDLKPLASQIIRQGANHLLVFDLTSVPDLPQKVLAKFGNALNLFSKLDQLQEISQTGQSTLQEINIFIERKPAPKSEDSEELQDDIPGLFLFGWLSDGEQSFLGRMALLSMLDTEDSLIVLDEPEVHFNDYWKREVVSLLDKVMSEHNNHLLITTHSSILLSDVTDNQITVLVKDDMGISRQRRPGIKTFGADPSEIMSVTFQADVPSGKLSTDELTFAVTEGNRQKVVGLLEQVGPGMWRFRLKQRLGEIDASSNQPA